MHSLRRPPGRTPAQCEEYAGKELSVRCREVGRGNPRRSEGTGYSTTARKSAGWGTVRDYLWKQHRAVCGSQGDPHQEYRGVSGCVGNAAAAVSLPREHEITGEHLAATG